MPELPEVETVREGLQRSVVGHRLQAMTVYEPRLRWPVGSDLPRVLAGQTLTAVRRRSKYLLLKFERDTLLAHLGMTGRFGIHRPPVPARAKHDHVEWQFDRELLLRYNDARRIGSLHRIADEAAHPLLAALGPEPFDEGFNGAFLYGALRKRSGPIKPALMDSHLVVGIGNIYASEALFRTGIHPARAANRVSAERCDRLAAEVKVLLREAIDAGGTTLRDFVNSEGQAGCYQFSNRVYGRAGQACLVCGSPIKQLRQTGRSTFYCARCQR